MSDDIRPELAAVQARLSRTLDEVRVEAAAKRHAEGYFAGFQELMIKRQIKKQHVKMATDCLNNRPRKTLG